METNIACREMEVIMSWINEDTYSGFWDLGGFFGTDLLTSPFRRMIRSDAERAGIDLHNPSRSVASLLGSCGMGAALGSILGPPGGILGGLLGYAIAIGSQYEGDQTETIRDAEATALYILELKALQIAVEVIQGYTDVETWAEICEEVGYDIEDLFATYDPYESLENSVILMFEVVSKSIRRIDLEAYLEFFSAYEEARWELGL
jgi:hypothetical protein